MAAFHLVNNPDTHCVGNLVGPRADIDVFEKKKISSPYQDSNYGLCSPKRSRCTELYIVAPNQKVKLSRYRPGVAQRVGRGIALHFHDRGTRRGWVVSSTPRPHFTPGKAPVSIVQEAGWILGPVWKGGKSRPHLDSIRDRPARSQSLHRLSYPAQKSDTIRTIKFRRLRCAEHVARVSDRNGCTQNFIRDTWK